MSSFESGVVWFFSFLSLGLILFFAYKISYRLGIKKALYRTSYIILSVIFAFLLAPVFNRVLFTADLSKFNIELTYRNQKFYTIIDYIEEVLAHSDFFNDLYEYFPSLKQLFMDFPEVILAPITYVILFSFFIILFLPLYLYLSYKRKRRVLYERKDNKSHHVWAGILGCVHAVLIISIILTPINGFNRVYHAAINDTLDPKYNSICEENEALQKYSYVCEWIDIYNSTIYANVGGENTINDYVFDALTRIASEDGYTSVSKEASLIIKGSIVLDQSGLLDSVSNEVIPLDAIVNNTLSDRDIDIIIETLRDSKYSQDILLELGELVVNTLDSLVHEFLNYDDFSTEYILTNENVISEIKVVLRAIKSLSGTNLLNEIMNAKDVIFNFVETYPMHNLDDIGVFGFIVNLVNSIDMDNFQIFVEALHESDTFRKLIPYAIDKLFYEFGFNFVPNETDVLDKFYYFWDFGRLVKKYQPNDFFDLMVKMSNDDLVLLATLFENVIDSPATKGFIDFIFSNVFVDFSVYSLSDIYKIENWQDEVFYIRDFCAIMYDLRATGDVSISAVIDLLKNSDSQAVQIIVNVFQRNLDLFIEIFITGGPLL